MELNGKEMTIGAVLQKILDGQYVKLVEHNKKILLIPSDKTFTLENVLPAKYHFYGYVKERSTLEPLVNATIYEPATKQGTISNNYGYFNFPLPEGNHILEVTYGGYHSQTIELTLHANIRNDITLVLASDTIAAIVVKASAQPTDGALKITDEQATYGGYMNEDDPLQYLYMSPGLQNATYSFSNFQVRGGGEDENLFLLDGNPVYNPTHLLGAISILNPTVIKAMRFYRSDIPAKFGGSLSSILDVHTRQGNMKRWQVEVHAGLLAGSLTLEGPLVKDKIALMVSARKSIPIPFYDSLQDGVTSHFYDAHIRLSAIVNPRNKVAISLYKGEDRLNHDGNYVDNSSRWGNTNGTLSWNYILGGRSFINTSINYSEYKTLGNYEYALFENDADVDSADIETDEDIEIDEQDDLSIGEKYIGTYSHIKNYYVKSQAEIYVSKKLKLLAGLGVSQTHIKPFDNKITSTLEEEETNFTSFSPLQFEELSFYTEAETKLSKKFFIKPGFRINAYQLNGYRTLAIQPRFYTAYQFHPKHKFYASYSRMNQFLHRVTNPYAGINRDLWVPASEILRPEESDIYNLGYAFQSKSFWYLTLDGYYKRLKNVTGYAEGKSTFINSTNWEQNIELGKGRSYGAEIMLKRQGEKFVLQATYALSWSWRQFSSINNGKEFPYKHDHRHAVNFGFTYSPTSRIDLTGLWSFSTGDMYLGSGLVFTDTIVQVPNTDPLNEYQFTYSFSEAHQHRAKSYQRYDIAIVYHSRKNKKLYSSIKAGVYNINGADGQYSYNVRGSLSSKTIRIKTGSSTFSLIPYLSLTLKF